MKTMEPLQILVAPVHDVVGTGFWREFVQCLNIVAFTVGYVDKRRDRSAQVDQRVQLHGGLGSVELGPRKQFQTEIDGCRIQRVNRLREIGYGWILGIQFTCLGNQHLGEVGEDAPVPTLDGICERGTADGTTDPEVV